MNIIKIRLDQLYKLTYDANSLEVGASTSEVHSLAVKIDSILRTLEGYRLKEIVEYISSSEDPLDTLTEIKNRITWAEDAVRRLNKLRLK